ncbi:hypothetical protein CDD82_6233 [Ophiocordyceps australis]|uniref:RING-type E3 ubiquitin transferase n=1 Tax=Ophiocordyceps australis TaxID=1399860 RepID=A0A2C5YWR1_9HYPO|nr:hypothetical protein CDD82_6233 [Ophiocordyceps australis]
MASHNNGGGRIDATPDGELVYCHACTHEWHRDGANIDCPECGSDITEIINPDNDPREPENLGSVFSSPELRSSREEDYSDPEEADLEEHIGPHGFIHRRSVRQSPSQGPPHDANLENVVRRFYEMLQTFGHPRPSNVRESSAQPGDDQTAWPRFHRATFTSGPLGGTASVTIFSGPSPGCMRNQGLCLMKLCETILIEGSIFSDVLRDIGPPQGSQQGGPPPNFARGLQEIFSLLSPASAMAGDAVYSQEALDRIITQLMEANPQSNAAPPASQEALQTLERKTVNIDMLKGESKTECTICIDEMKVGDRAVVLPCKHWFHEECVVLWLKEHNTCPICRTPIEKTGNSSGSTHGSGGGDSDTGDSAPGATGPPATGSSRQGSGTGQAGGMRSFTASFGGFGRSGANAMGEGSNGMARSTAGVGRPGGLGEALRAITSIQQVRDAERGQDFQGGYDTLRFQRRRADSSTSPTGLMSNEVSSQARQPSPSESRRRMANHGSGRQTSLGPLSWLRDRFSGGGGGGGSQQGSCRE